jgi:putative tricarboxylic transport membrane protein
VSPILLALILGPMAEQNFRRSLMIAQGDTTIFLTRPLSAAFIILAILSICSSSYKLAKSRRAVSNA